ncbi:hypothetical protein ABF87_08550 [Nitrosomonas sp. JL21]|uniref:hypothetical protein n=1 Tax=Nitrosomonas sp. JL21 TaxID=153949 RepID=UPI001368ECC6|nr:hypothetical protein [Nitrosomonas sp. JL21]MBL8498824.1 hypothetical protein [Nitrosomonas sp.]MXS78008.1 hypothetical protein [Nitrosomonas sp. JL21]
MLKKLFLIIVLSSSVSCFADTGDRKSNALIDSSQQNRSSDAKQKSQSSQSAPSVNQGNPQSSQGSGSGSDPKPPMVEYCKKHTC